METSKKTSLLRLAFINIFIFLILIFCLEAGARIFLHFLRGSSTVGMPERMLYLRYRPFVMFGPDWDNLLSPAKHLASKNNAPICRVLLIGGSTAAFFPTEVLEQALTKKFPRHQFEVINAAEGGYIARQEVVTAAIWGTSLNPDIVLTLDGANDLTHRLRMDKAGTFFLDSAYDFALKQPMLSPFAEILRHSQFVQGAERLKERATIGSVAQYQDAVPVYIAAEHSINVLAKGLTATRIMVLQPFLSFKNPLSSQEASFKNYQYREAVIMALYEQLNQALTTLAKQDGVIYIDGRSLYNQRQETVFSDDVHFINSNGYIILANAIVSHLTENDLQSHRR